MSIVELGSECAPMPSQSPGWGLLSYASPLVSPPKVSSLIEVSAAAVPIAALTLNSPSTLMPVPASNFTTARGPTVRRTPAGTLRSHVTWYTYAAVAVSVRSELMVPQRLMISFTPKFVLTVPTLPAASVALTLNASEFWSSVGMYGDEQVVGAPALIPHVVVAGSLTVNGIGRFGSETSEPRRVGSTVTTGAVVSTVKERVETGPVPSALVALTPNVCAPSASAADVNGAVQ